MNVLFLLMNVMKMQTASTFLAHTYVNVRGDLQETKIFAKVKILYISYVLCWSFEQGSNVLERQDALNHHFLLLPTATEKILKK